MAAESIGKNLTTGAKNSLTSAKNALHGHGIGLGGMALDLGLNAYFGMKEGDNLGTSLIKAVPQSIAWAVAPGVMGTYMAASLIPAAAQGYMGADQNLRQKYNQNRKAGTMFSYMDTRQAVTMRQASVQAIQGSKMNARNALGGEAALMHRSWTDRMGM